MPYMIVSYLNACRDLWPRRHESAECRALLRHYLSMLQTATRCGLGPLRLRLPSGQPLSLPIPDRTS